MERSHSSIPLLSLKVFVARSFRMPSGQSQKEFYFNQAMSLVDALLSARVEGELSSPPASPGESQCWIVGDLATDDWQGHEGEIAVFVAGGWSFVSPENGMALFNKAAGQNVFYSNGWTAGNSPILPSGGTVVDLEARTAISEIIDILKETNLIPDT